MQRYVVRDLGASFGKTEPSRFLWILPISMRGFGQGTRNNIDDFESQRFIEHVDENDVEFDFHTIYGSVLDLVDLPMCAGSPNCSIRSLTHNGKTRSGQPITARTCGRVHQENQSQDC